MIRVPQVRVVDEDGSQLGVMATAEALRLAQERGYDLVEVAPMASPPVVRLLDFGQYKYELTKREKEAKRKQRSVTFKEVRLKPKIGTGDFDTKVRRAIEFLEEGDRVKVAVQFRGRELTHPEIGRNLLSKFADQIKDHGLVERAPMLEGKAMHITVASTHKPKVQEPGAAPKPATEPAATAEQAATAEPQPKAIAAEPPKAAPPEPTVAAPPEQPAADQAETPPPPAASEPSPATPQAPRAAEAGQATGEGEQAEKPARATPQARPTRPASTDQPRQSRSAQSADRSARTGPAEARPASTGE